MQLLMVLVLSIQLILFYNVINGNLTSGNTQLLQNKTDLISGKGEEISPLSERMSSNGDPGFNLDRTVPKMLQSAKKKSKHRGKALQTRRRNGKRGKIGKSGKRGRGSNIKRNRNRRPVKEAEDVEKNLDPRKLLRDTMSHMFGFDHMTVASNLRNTDAPPVIRDSLTDPDFDVSAPAQSIDEDLDSTSDEEAMPDPPNFMLELYRTYSEDKRLMFLHSKSHGNTVRSFFPSPADPRLYNRGRGKPITISFQGQPSENNRDLSSEYEEPSNTLSNNHMSVFLFNLSSIPTPEEIVRTDIRLDGLQDGAKIPFDQNDEDDFRFPDTGSDPGNPRNDNTEVIRNRPVSGNSENNATDESSWYLLVAVYRKDRRECAEPDCHSDDSEIFTKVGRPLKLKSSPSVTVWSTQELVKFAVKARKSEHVLVVKFQKSASDTHGSGNEFLRRHSRHTSKANPDLPNVFTVADSERPKRNSGHKRNKSYNPASSVDPALSGFDKNWFDGQIYRPPIPILVVYCNDSRTVVEEESAFKAPVIWGAIGNITESFKLRNRRSANTVPDSDASAPDTLDDNRIPGEESNVNDSEQNTELKKPIMVEKRKSSRSKIDSTESLDPQPGNDTIPRSSKRNRKNPNEQKKKRKSRRCSDKRGKQRKMCRNRRIRPHASVAGKNRPNEACGRKSLPVDFADIGWSEWIISPKFFDAYYCTGKCELKEMKGSNPSNHAIIQALIKSLGTNKDLPAPCCVPEKLMSLSVLFFDASRNVVLKVYPNMSVETCACR